MVKTRLFHNSVVGRLLFVPKMYYTRKNQTAKRTYLEEKGFTCCRTIRLTKLNTLAYKQHRQYYEQNVYILKISSNKTTVTVSSGNSINIWCYAF